MDKNKRFDKFYMEFAISAANFSYCVRKRVGAVLVKDDVIVMGYNGTMPGLENSCEGEDGETLWHVLHAESNALGKVMTSTINSAGATMYCTFSPCIHCAKQMIQAKISRFVYLDDHSDQRGLEMMRHMGIQVEKINLFEG